MKNEIIKEAKREKKIVLLEIPFYEKLFNYYADMTIGNKYYAFIIICSVVSLMQLWDFLHIVGLVFIIIWFAVSIGVIGVKIYFMRYHRNSKVYFITAGKRKVLNHEWSLHQLPFLDSLFLMLILCFTFVTPFALSQTIIAGTGWASTILFLAFIPLNYYAEKLTEHFFPDKYLVSSTKRFNDLTVLLQ